jgi:hypothetical protein
MHVARVKSAGRHQTLASGPERARRPVAEYWMVEVGEHPEVADAAPDAGANPPLPVHGRAVLTLDEVHEIGRQEPVAAPDPEQYDEHDRRARQVDRAVGEIQERPHIARIRRFAAGRGRAERAHASYEEDRPGQERHEPERHVTPGPHHAGHPPARRRHRAIRLPMGRIGNPRRCECANARG